MSKFYKHNIDDCIRKQADRRRKANAQNAIPVASENQILHLIQISEEGLPDCYKSFTDFLFDFWPDFSWVPQEAKLEVQAVLSDSRFKEVAPILKEAWDVDMKEELTRALTESQRS